MLTRQGLNFVLPDSKPVDHGSLEKPRFFLKIISEEATFSLSLTNTSEVILDLDHKYKPNARSYQGIM